MAIICTPMADYWLIKFFFVFDNFGQVFFFIEQFLLSLAEIFRSCEFDDWNDDLHNMQITYDMLILTVGHEDNLSSLEALCSSPKFKSEENLDGRILSEDE